jgi:hypothetical protein
MMSIALSPPRNGTTFAGRVSPRANALTATGSNRIKRPTRRRGNLPSSVFWYTQERLTLR